jgi:hypothetical protein
VLAIAIEQHHGQVALQLSAEVCRLLHQIIGAHADVILTGLQAVALADQAVIVITGQSVAQLVWAWADQVLLE